MAHRFSHKYLNSFEFLKYNKNIKLGTIQQAIIFHTKVINKLSLHIAI